MSTERWRIQIDSTGPTYEAALSGVARQLTEAIAIGKFVGTQVDDSDPGCLSTIKSTNLHCAGDEPTGGRQVRNVAEAQE